MKATHLQTEYLTAPLGLGCAVPQFSWQCADGLHQTAYRITAERDDAQIWDSGKICTAQTAHIPYGGAPLQSRDRVTWTVQLWDENDASGPVTENWFELGLLRDDDWKAHWITGSYKPKKNIRYPVDGFCKTFTCTGMVKRARLYITACGLYRAELNGERVGDFEPAPGSTDYRKRLQYQTYDVTVLLQDENTLTVELADGWYRGSIGCFGPTNVFGRRTGLLAQLEWQDACGTHTLCTDESWQWSNDGPRLFADLKDGEIIDARLTYSFARRAALLPNTEKIPTPTAADNVAPRQKERFTPKLLHTPSGKLVLDFGQNLAGFVAFTARGAAGKKIALTLGEILDENGEFTQANMVEHKPVKEFGRLGEVLLMTGNGKLLPGEKQLTPKQQIVYTCAGQNEQYCTRFAVFGFRYALVESDYIIDPDDFAAVAVYSDMERTGWFRCSDERVNRLFENTVWSMKSNFLDVPTDCPTRERLGWTGDAQAFFETGAYIMNVAPFYRKWLRDLQDNQKPDGKISAVAPYNGLATLYDSTGDSVGWADAAILVPWRYYKRYGDKKLLAENYPLMQKLADHRLANTGRKDKKQAAADPLNKYVYEKGMHLGEWLEPAEFQENIAAGKQPPHTEECTAYLHYSMQIMAEAAATLGKTEDAARYADCADGARRAYRKLFLQNGAPDTDRQAKLVRPLALGLADDDAELKTALQARLAKAVENRKYKVGTGFLSTPFVLPMLAQANRTDLAYKMLLNPEKPGWLYEVAQGATTVWETWEGNVSRNHYSPGAVCQWLFEGVAGITAAGERHFKINPCPDASLDFAEAVYDSFYGTVSCKWTRAADGTVTAEIIIPPNTTADFNGETLQPGCYERSL